MALTWQQKWRIAGRFRNVKNGRGETIALTKQELFDAVEAIDNTFDSTATIFNQAIPLPARTTLSLTDKAELFMQTARTRWLNNGE